MTEFLQVPGGQLAYDLTGEGPLVVCLPGMGDVRASYRFVVPQLVAAGYRVATMDLRGHGESSTGWDSHLQSAVGGDIVALIKKLGGPAIVIGQSASPGAAVVAAAIAPAEVVGLVLIAPFHTNRAPKGIMALAEKLVLRFPALWGMFYTSLYPGVKPADFREYRAALKATLREPGRMPAVGAIGGLAAVDSHPYRARVTQPTLIVMGTKDSDFPDPAAEASAMAAALPGPTQVVMIDKAGHYPQAQYPAETTAAILAFLTQTVRS